MDILDLLGDLASDEAVLPKMRDPSKDALASLRDDAGDYKHELSQDARYYLTEKGHADQFDSIG